MSTILIIDDEPEICDTIYYLLQDQEFELLRATSGQEGTQLAQKHQPDLILCDVVMPGMDGYEVLRQLRQESSTVAIPFIFLTAKSSAKEIRQGMLLGADDYLPKPFTRRELLSVIQTRLSQRAQLKDYYSRSLDQLRRSVAIALPHEFRTPLMGILGASDFLLSCHRDLEPTLIDELLVDIQNSGKRLHQLIQKFLYFVRLQELCQDEQPLYASLVGGVPELIQGIVNQLIIPANRLADFQLELEVEAIAIATTDLDYLLRELLDNAVKFSDIGTPITLKIWKTDQCCQMQITDRGRGMNPAQIAQIGAYQQFDRDQYEQQGTGLGLAIAQLITKIYNGTLAIDSVQNEGTTIKISLPQPAELYQKPDSLLAD